MPATVSAVPDRPASSANPNGKRCVSAWVASVIVHLGALAMLPGLVASRPEPPSVALDSRPERIQIHLAPKGAESSDRSIPVAAPSPPRPSLRNESESVRKTPVLQPLLVMDRARLPSRVIGPTMPAARGWTPLPFSAPNDAGGVDADVDGVDSVAAPDYLRNPPPSYPRLARERSWSGTTLLRVEVLANGTAGAIEIVRSSGYRILDEASVEAVRGWKFHPARRNQEPVRAWVEVPITFALQKS